MTPTAEVELFSLAGHDGYLRAVNGPFASLLGLTPAEINGRSLLELVHPEDITPIVAGLAALEGGAAEIVVESRFMLPNGQAVHLQWVARPLPGSDLWWAAGRDTTELHRLVAAGIELRARLDLALGQAKAAMWELDFHRDRLTWEPRAAEVFGVDADAVPATMAELVAAAHPEDAAAVTAAVEQLAGAGVIDVRLRIGHEAGQRHLSLRGKVLDRDRRGRALRAVGLVLDITAEKAMEEQMLRMVMSDALTGVPNRRAFDHALRSEVRRCIRGQEPLSVVMVDIDDFKSFNDTFGHLVGDAALVAVARAMIGTVHRAGDMLARFGGEEFALVLPGVDAQGAMVVAERMLAAVRAVRLHQADDRALSVSVGTASWQPHSAKIAPLDLLARADDALYAAKNAGKDRAVAYEQSLAASDMYQAAIARGLVEGEFEMHYQPIITLATGEVGGFEALMRWNRPGHGLVPPDAFIGVAEASNLICDLGRWALTQATEQLATWSRLGLDPDGKLLMAVNVSGRQIIGADIVDEVRAALVATGIAPSRLELEVTETVLVENGRAAVRLAELRALGVRISIDDFGTGHTSIGQLPLLSVDTLKIDRSFVASADPRISDLVTLIIGAAHAFDLRVVAEGVEDPVTLQHLRDIGCDTAQGFLMSRPLHPALVPGWLAQWRSRLRIER